MGSTDDTEPMLNRVAGSDDRDFRLLPVALLLPNDSSLGTSRYCGGGGTKSMFPLPDSGSITTIVIISPRSIRVTQGFQALLEMHTFWRLPLTVVVV